MLTRSLLIGALALSHISEVLGLDVKERQIECINGTLEVEYPIVTFYPVVIDQYFKANTIININGGVQININNAPTYLSTLVTGTDSAISTMTTRVTATSTDSIVTTETTASIPTANLILSTSSTSSASSSPTTDSTPATSSTPTTNPTSTQVVSATVTTTSTFTSTATGSPTSSINIAGAKARRQQDTSNLYLTSSGRAVEDNFQASMYRTRDEELLTLGRPIAVNYPGSASAIVGIGASGLLTTSFVVSGNSLTWVNSAFANGEAVFCLQENTLRAIFDGSSINNCVVVTLTTLPVPDGFPTTQSSASSSSSTTEVSILPITTGEQSSNTPSTTSSNIPSSTSFSESPSITSMSTSSTSSESSSTSVSSVASEDISSTIDSTSSSTSDIASSTAATSSSSTEGSSSSTPSPSETPRACTGTQIFCDGACVNQTISNCGTCGNSCLGYSSFYGEPYVCDTSTGSIENGIPGACASVSPQGCFPCTDECGCGSEPGVCTPGGYCVYEVIDKINCGAIGNVCKAPSDTCHNGQCVDLQTDQNNCGLAGLVCGADESGVQDSCVNGTCTSLSSNADNCGAIGNKCPGARPQCVNGTCLDLSNNTSNCGYIRYQCNESETCQGGLCYCGTSEGCGGGGTCTNGACV